MKEDFQETELENLRESARVIKNSQLRSFVIFSVESRIYTLAVHVEIFSSWRLCSWSHVPSLPKRRTPLIITFKPFSSLASFRPLPFFKCARLWPLLLQPRLHPLGALRRGRGLMGERPVPGRWCWGGWWWLLDTSQQLGRYMRKVPCLEWTSAPLWGESLYSRNEWMCIYGLSWEVYQSE